MGGGEDVGTHQHFEGKFRDDTELVPDEVCAEGDKQDCKALEVDGLAVSTNHLHVSGVADRGLVGKTIVVRFINKFRTEPESERIQTGRVCTAPSTKKSCILGVPRLDSSLIAGRAGSMTCTGDPPRDD